MQDNPKWAIKLDMDFEPDYLNAGGFWGMLLIIFVVTFFLTKTYFEIIGVMK